IPVIAGPIEATALGNIIIQLTALGAIKDIANGRELIRKTEPVKTYNPCEVTAWKDAYEKYRRLL
ncbi:MAG: rhamnulokinase, partial [Oscillospiraceae bacterium]